jgi:PAS domain S-box-containing protein
VSALGDQRLTLGAFVVAVVVLAAIGSYAVRNARLVVRYGTAVEQHQSAIIHLSRVALAVTAVESATRAYVLTGDDAFLESQRDEEHAARAELDALRGPAAAAGDSSRAALERLAGLVAERLALAAELQRLRREAGLEPAQAHVAGGAGRRLQQQIDDAVLTLRQAADRELAAARDRAEQAADELRTAALVGGAVALLLVGLAGAHAALDMRALRRADAAVRASEAELRTLSRQLERILDASLDAICVFDAAGRFVHASAACERLWGWRPDELRGTPYLDKVLAEDRERTRASAAAIMAGRETLDFRNRYRHKDGSIVHVMWSARWLDDDARMFCIARDVTEAERLRAQLQQQYDELARTAAALERARDRAEAADRTKSAFLATMSHELRTPLNTIIGFTGVLLQRLPGPLNDEQAKQLALVRGSARHLLALINDVLDISKIEAGDMKVACAPFDLRASIERAAAIIRPQAEARGLRLVVQVADGLGAAVGDPRRAEQVLLNLLSNAVKFTDHGSVTLAAEAADGGAAVRLRVIDTGSGIRADDLPRLFRPFEQLEGVTGRAREGTGLGLAISRRLAELMGGRIDVHSRWQQGSEFTFTLPRSEETQP